MRLHRVVPACIGGCLVSTLIIADGRPALNAGLRPAQDTPATVGEWSPVYSLPIAPVHMHVLPNGKVLLWQGFVNESGTRTYVWDPAGGISGQAIDLGTPIYDTAHIFCSGHAFLPDGRLLVAGGGHGQTDAVTETHIFDYRTNTWSRGPDMPVVPTGSVSRPNTQAGRYYPSVIPLSTGEMLVAAGESGPSFVNTTPIVLNTDMTFRALPSRLGFAWESWYPFLFAAPDGNVYRASGSNVDASSTEHFYAGYLNTSAGTWTPETKEFSARAYGSAVMYEPGKILITGGGNQAGGCGVAPTDWFLSSADRVDLTGSSPQWSASNMHYAREYHNMTVLADGRVFVSGGVNSAGAVRTPEMWNPATDTWTDMKAMAVDRGYHSTAILLPDGRVFSAGSLAGACNQLNAEFYSPPYLFGGLRPTITSAATVINAGAAFVVGTADTGITDVTLVRLSSVTHGFNQNQRFNRLAFTTLSGGLSVTGPTLSQAPPGHYMLFILKNGVPSVASIVQLQGPAVGSDFNRDGYPDLVWHNTSTGAIEIWHMGGGNESIGFSSLDSVLVRNISGAAVGATSPYRLAALGEFSPQVDSRPDLLWQHDAGGDHALAAWLMYDSTLLDTIELSPPANVNPPQPLDPNWKVLATPDFNVDGHADLFFRHSQTGNLALWWMNGVNKTGGGYMVDNVAGLPPVVVPDPAWRVAGIGDFNNDTRPDIVWQHDTTYQIQLWYTLGDRRNTMQDLTSYDPGQIPPPIGWQVRAVGDFNRDSHPDLLLQNGTSLAVWTYNNTVRLNTVWVTTVGRASPWILVGAR